MGRAVRAKSLPAEATMPRRIISKLRRKRLFFILLDKIHLLQRRQDAVHRALADLPAR
jgi:hypothetical protein